MTKWKKASTHCKDCGVEFNDTNKYHKRALCKACVIKEQQAYQLQKRKDKSEHRHIKYEEFKTENRTDYYSAILAETKGMDRDEHREWLTNKLNEILQNKKLWEYISTKETNMKAKQSYRKKRLTSSKNLLENY